MRPLVGAALLFALVIADANAGRAFTARLPERLAETGIDDPSTRRFSPQYPLWSDGARKSRWVQLPPAATIDATDIDAWEFPVGTRFWKEFEFAGRKVETRVLWRSSEDEWTFGTYVWNDAQTEATLAPADGIAGVVEIAPGKRHSIPSIEDCRACHENGRVQVLGFTALQLSTDRDPDAPHAEPLGEDMVTLRTLVEENVFSPARPEFVARPPRIPGDAATRAALGYLAANCGNCHRTVGATHASPLPTVAYPLNMPAYATADDVRATVRALLTRTTKWDVPHTAPGTSTFLPAALARLRSRRPSSQMPPLGTVVADQQALELMTAWVRNLQH